MVFARLSCNVFVCQLYAYGYVLQAKNIDNKQIVHLCTHFTTPRSAWIETTHYTIMDMTPLVALPTEYVGRVNILVAGAWAILLGCRNTGLKLCCICHILIDKCRVETYIPCPC